MKQLLGMAREKKQKQPIKPYTNQVNPKQLPVYQQSEQQYQQDGEEYEPNEEEIRTYAEFLGIRLPEEEDLLWIAEEGLMAELPADWVSAEAEDGEEILYINTKTAQRTYQHPCDDFYKQLVLDERRKRNKIYPSKKSNNLTNQSKPFQSPSNVYPPPPPKSIVIDPLVKMQQEKEIKKLEELKKKQFDQKKNNLLMKFDQKKEDLVKQLKNKEDKIALKYQQQEASEKSKQVKQMSEKQREEEIKITQELATYEKQIRLKAEKAAAIKKNTERELIQAKIKSKKEEICLQLQNQLKQQKKKIDQQIKERISVFEEKEQKCEKDKEQSALALENEIKRIKNEIVKKKMREHADRIRSVNEQQKELYHRELAQLQKEHDERVAQIQKKQPKNKIKIEELIAECEQEEKEELKAFEYELEMLKEAKAFENEQKIQQFRTALEDNHEKCVNEVVKEYQKIYQQYKHVKKQELQAKVWESEKISREEYLKSLRSLEKKYEVEEEIIHLQNNRAEDNLFEKDQLGNYDQIILQLSEDEHQVKRDLEKLKLEIENLKSQNGDVTTKLNQNQMRLYQIIEEKLRAKK